MKIKIITIILTLIFSSYINAQELPSLNGKIVNTIGQPINGALIQQLKDSEIKTATNSLGEFSIDAQVGDLIFIETPDELSKLYKVENLEGQKIIVMNIATEGIDLGFGIKQTLETSTAAVSVSHFEDIDKRSALNLSNSLFGNTLGLTSLQYSNDLEGSLASFYIRGLKTMSSNSILIVVDGLERSLDQINVEDVETVSILKDAAAVALYGYKGVNGVLSVKTKRGKYNTNEIKFTYDHGVNWQIKKPKFVNSYNYARSINEALTNDGLKTRYSANDIQAFRDGKYPYLFPNVNWMDEVFKNTAANNIFNLSFRGGSMNMRYYTALNLETNNGFVKKAKEDLDYSNQMKYSKASLRTNLDIDLTNTTLMSVNIQGVLEEFCRPGLGSDNLIGKLYTVPAAAYPVKTYEGVWGGNSTWGTNTNPVALAQARGRSKGNNRSLYADVKLTQKLDFITKGLSTSLRMGYDNYASYWEGSISGYQWASQSVNMSTGIPTDTVTVKGGEASKVNYDSKLDAQDRHYNMIASVDYENVFDKHAVLGSFMYSYDDHSMNNRFNTYHKVKYSMFSHYGYDNRYVADVILNISGANHLAPGHKYEFSPTLGLGWIISNEKFMSKQSIVNFLKLRGSIGRIYADQIPKDNYWSQEFVGGNSYPFGDNFTWNSGTQEGLLPVTDIKNERALKMNIGVDGALWNNSISFSVDVYKEKRDNIFVSATNGYSTIIGNFPAFVNAGQVNSHGVELGVNHIKQYGDFIVNVGGKFTFNRNKIIEQLEDDYPYEYFKSTGKRVGQIFGLQALGFFIDEADIMNSPQQTFSTVKPGDIKYKDQNGDGIIDQYDMIAMGYNSQVPEIYYSFDLGVEWKGIGITASFQGVGNYSKMLYTQSVYRPLINNTNISEHYYENRWTPETANTAIYPRLTTESNDNNNYNSTIWLANASFLKMRNCELYYKLPTDLLKKYKIGNAKVYLRGIDLLTFSDLKIVDPESTGVAYPLTRSIHAGFSLNF